MTYKILWIDDQYDDQKGFITEAELSDIELICFKTSKAGMTELENNVHRYDGVLLDAKVYKDSENEAPRLSGLMASISKINQLKNTKVFPYFVFTGQPDLKTDETFEDMLNGQQSYYKGDDNEQLFNDIKKAADELPQTKIKHKYARVFEICTEDYIGEKAATELLDILEAVEGNKSIRDDLYFNRLRHILEYLFRAANRKGLLHDKCIANGEVNLSSSSLFLAGLPAHVCKVSCTKKHFPGLIADHVKNILNISNQLSHTTGKKLRHTNKHNYKVYQNMVNSPYLLYSLTFQLMDVLLWFKQYADKNKDIEVNKSYWKDMEESSNVMTGVIEQDENDNYHCGAYLLNYNYVRSNYKIGDKIKIISSNTNNNPRTKTQYPNFAHQFQRR